MAPTAVEQLTAPHKERICLNMFLCLKFAKLVLYSPQITCIELNKHTALSTKRESHVENNYTAYACVGEREREFVSANCKQGEVDSVQMAINEKLMLMAASH